MSFALPALIAMGVVRHVKKPVRVAFLRSRLIPRVLDLLGQIQPESGGFLEAAPLTGFVAMSLIGAGYLEHPVTQACLRFLEETQRPDGSWAIDVNLTTWVTSLSARALEGDLSEAQQNAIRDYLLKTQFKEEHLFNHAVPGGWGWTDRSGAVPDADDTAAALIALRQLNGDTAAAGRGIEWLLGLQNRDGGMPTFCKGWGKLPFDQSCPDLTAHAIRAFNAWRGGVHSRAWKKNGSVDGACDSISGEKRSDRMGRGCRCGLETSKTRIRKTRSTERCGCWKPFRIWIIRWSRKGSNGWKNSRWMIYVRRSWRWSLV